MALYKLSVINVAAPCSPVFLFVVCSAVLSQVSGSYTQDKYKIIIQNLPGPVKTSFPCSCPLSFELHEASFANKENE